MPLLHAFVAFVASATILFISGSVILYFLRININKPFAFLFSSLSCGLILSVMLYSLMVTKGCTISWAYFFLLIFGIIHYRKFSSVSLPVGAYKVPLNASFFRLLLLIFLMLPVFAFLLFFYQRPGMPVPIVALNDFMFYADVIQFMNATGKESYVYDYIFTNEVSPLPYHYFELWISGLISWGFKLNAYVSYYFSSRLIFALLISAGLLCIFENLFSRIVFSHYLLAVLFIFFCGNTFGLDKLSILAPLKISGGTEFMANILLLPKIETVYFFLLIILALLLYGQAMLSLYFMLALGVSYFTVLPSVCAAIVIFFFIHFKKKNFPAEIKFFLPAFICIVLFYALFYWVNKPEVQTFKQYQLAEFLNYLFTAASLKIVFNIIASTFIRIGVIFLPMAVLAFFYRKEILKLLTGSLNKAVLSLLFLCSIIGLIAWSIDHPVLGSVQLFQNFSTPFFNLFFFLVPVVLVSIGKIHKYLAALLFTVTGFLSLYYTFSLAGYQFNYNQTRYSYNYIESVYASVKNLNKVSCIDLKFESDKNIFEKNSFVHPQRTYLGLTNPGYLNVSLSVFDFKLSTTAIVAHNEKNFREVSIFYRYVEKLKNQQSFFGIAEAKCQFIEEYKIDYMFLNGVDLNELLKPYVSKTIRDEKSGEECVIFNPSVHKAGFENKFRKSMQGSRP